MKLIFIGTFLAASTALAQEGLYAPTPPANSAFVRVVGTSTASLNTKTLTAEKGAISSYVVIPEGSVTVRAGSASQKFTVTAGKFYSVLVSSGKLSLLTDQSTDNKAKALITMYNISSTPALDLKTADGKLSVISSVKPGESGSRAVNGITVDLAAFNGSKSLGTLKGATLERGNAYAIVVTDAGITLTTSTTK